MSTPSLTPSMVQPPDLVDPLKAFRGPKRGKHPTEPGLQLLVAEMDFIWCPVVALWLTWCAGHSDVTECCPLGEKINTKIRPQGSV